MASLPNRRAIYWLLRSPSQTCHAKPKTQINRRRTLPASFPLVGCLPQAAWLKDFEKSGRWHCSRLRSVALYLWLIVVISVRQSTVATISGLHCRAGYGQFEHKADSLMQNSKKRAERSERLMYEQSHRDYLALVICITSSAAAWAVNHYRDNAITYKNDATKCQRTEAGERGNYWHAGRQRDVAALDAKCRVADAKAENDALRDDVAAGRRRLHVKQSVSQCVKPPPPPAWIMQPPPDWQTPLNGIISPLRERLITMQKQLEGNPEVY